MRVLYVFLTIVAFAAHLAAQTIQPTPMIVTFAPGEHLRYDLKAEFIYDPHLEEGVSSDMRPCSYRLATALDLEVVGRAADNSVTGNATFGETEISQWQCEKSIRAVLQKELVAMAAAPYKFAIASRGIVKLTGHRAANPMPSEALGSQILIRTLVDVLQTRISSQAIAPGAAPKNSPAFVYPAPEPENDDTTRYLVASMKYVKNVELAARPFALLEFNQVLQPVDEKEPPEAHPTENYTRATYTVGEGKVTALFDTAAKRIAYVRRNIDIESRVSFEYSDTSTRVATVYVTQRAAARLVPDTIAEQWFAALDAFEAPPAVKAQPRAPRQSKALYESVEQIDQLPKGFQRYTRQYCRWPKTYCVQVSVPVPNGSKVAMEDEAVTTMSVGAAATDISIAIGPYEKSTLRGLTNEEVLARESERFLSNPLWFTGSPGKKIYSWSGTVGAFTQHISEFTSQDRNSKPIRGFLLMTTYVDQYTVPVACWYPAGASDEAAYLCNRIVEGVRVTR